MTRTERIEQYLRDNLMTGDNPRYAPEILAIADNRTLIGLKTFSERIGRNRTTIKSWQARGNVTVPEPAYQTENGPLWDAEVIEQFCRTYPELVRHAD